MQTSSSWKMEWGSLINRNAYCKLQSSGAALSLSGASGDWSELQHYNDSRQHYFNLGLMI